MPSTEAPTWWADVQQEREDLAGPGRRPAEDWLGEDIDFVPRRRRIVRQRDAAHDERPAAGADHPLHGVFIAADHRDRAAAELAAAGSVTIELGTGRPVVDPAPVQDADVAHELRHLRAADDPFATPPPPPGTRRTVQIKGRPGEVRLPSLAQRHRPRTASDRVGHRPDRIALWAVALGAILILLAAMTSSSQAAVAHRVTVPRTAHVVHHVKAPAAAHHRATVRLARTHR
jgi:hypothetical protein